MRATTFLSLVTAMALTLLAQRPPIASAEATAGVGRALLVGIDHYAPTTEQLQAAAERGKVYDSERQVGDLKGAENDAITMAGMLTARYGFTSVRTLINEQATREAILAGLEGLAQARPDDRVVFYFSGHGSQAHNRGATNPTHMDQTLVPVDAVFGAPEIRDKELKLLLNKILDRCPNLTVIVDACHSRSITRSPFDTGTARALAPRDGKDSPEALARLDAITRRAAAQPDPTQRGALVVSACDADQVARETEDTSGKHRGALTLALTETMQEVTEREPALRVFERVGARMRALTTDQDPVLDGTSVRKAAALFGGVADAIEGTAVPVLPRKAYLADQEVELGGGFAAGLRPGMQLSQAGASHTSPVRVRVTQVNGPVACRAEAIQGAVAGLKAGDMFRLDDGQIANDVVVRLWLPPAENHPELLAFIRELRHHPAASSLLTADPTEATHVLRWERGWLLQATVGVPTLLGRCPSAGDVFESVKSLTRPAVGPVGGVVHPAKLFVIIPPASDFREQLIELVRQHPTLGLTQASDSADYQLVATLTGGELGYAWVRPQVHAKMPSGLPTTTAWARSSQPAEQLVRQACTIAKIKGWLELKTPVDKGRFPYRLQLQRVKLNKTHDVTARGEYRRAGELREGESFQAVLTATGTPPTHLEKRHVYVFVIDERGESRLLFPGDDGSAMLPPDGRLTQANRAVPVGPPFTITGPGFGPTTFVMLTSVQPLSDPSVLSFSGVKGHGQFRSAFEHLLVEISSGTRGEKLNPPVVFTPPGWSIERMAFVTVTTSFLNGASRR
jgi:hypothetical protein